MNWMTSGRYTLLPPLYDSRLEVLAVPSQGYAIFASSVALFLRGLFELFFVFPPPPWHPTSLRVAAPTLARTRYDVPGHLLSVSSSRCVRRSATVVWRLLVVRVQTMALIAK